MKRGGDTKRMKNLSVKEETKERFDNLLFVATGVHRKKFNHDSFLNELMDSYAKFIVVT